MPGGVRGAKLNCPGFIIGGGPSLRGFDFSELRGLRSMAINTAFKDVPWADIALIGDTRLLDHLAVDEDWARFTGDRYTRASQLSRAKELQPKEITPLETQETWSRRQGCVVSLGNAGLCGVNLAELLGWSPIFLLGFDASGDRGDGRMANYHDHYPREWAKPEMFSKNKFMRIFESVESDVQAQIYNCNPDSAIDCFQKIAPKEAFSLCRS